jgi:hypothetical protein
MYANQNEKVRKTRKKKINENKKINESRKMKIEINMNESKEVGKGKVNEK